MWGMACQESLLWCTCGTQGWRYIKPCFTKACFYCCIIHDLTGSMWGWRGCFRMAPLVIGHWSYPGCGPTALAMFIIEMCKHNARLVRLVCDHIWLLVDRHLRLLYTYKSHRCHTCDTVHGMERFSRAGIQSVVYNDSKLLGQIWLSDLDSLNRLSDTRASFSMQKGAKYHLPLGVSVPSQHEEACVRRC